MYEYEDAAILSDATPPIRLKVAEGTIIGNYGNTIIPPSAAEISEYRDDDYPWLNISKRMATNT